jgi:hypothetical protein
VNIVTNNIPHLNIMEYGDDQGGWDEEEDPYKSQTDYFQTSPKGTSHNNSSIFESQLR